MEERLKGFVRECLLQLYGVKIEDHLVQLQATRKDFEGDITLVVFPLVKYSMKSPENTAGEIGEKLSETVKDISGYNVINGFLNISFSSDFWCNQFIKIAGSENFGFHPAGEDAGTVLVEYSSPNTNKPLHLGHIRNNLLGFSLSRILEANGKRVIRTNIVNDRGIHICKSMLAWMKFGNGETPESAGEKGDHLVGRYYVRFEKEMQAEASRLNMDTRKRISVEGDGEAGPDVPLLAEARELLRKWEAGDQATIELWKRMNSWVYEGFDSTYDLLGVYFDKVYYESETYKTGREIVLQAQQKGLLETREDGSVWADLSGDNLDQKLLLRSDGTAVYMTQDLGTAVERYNDFHFSNHYYVVGNEQNYHFQVLRIVLKKLGYDWADGIHHFSYGMVELPEGKMKSREGTVVDADDLVAEMFDTAREMSEELGKLEDFSDEEREQIFRKIGLGALKYYMLKVDPRKNMMFNPAESIDFNGNTGPFIQYTYARIQSLLRKAGPDYGTWPEKLEPNRKETEIIKMLDNFPEIVAEAGRSLSPALVANYCYVLAREYNQYYHDFTVLGEKDSATRAFRIELSKVTGRVIFSSMWLLGIDMPDRM